MAPRTFSPFSSAEPAVALPTCSAIAITIPARIRVTSGAMRVTGEPRTVRVRIFPAPPSAVARRIISNPAFRRSSSA
eukprot:CAMPEP_0180124606 /NCGR_PEP_ID=MMETSP0986-20121125/4741_1 /TAXON_ID=697907 /ORGANISM="non described non described, Strain CCMP2293" /LENGTH=76 /DNA_ID=CAMNT_0022063957 /DNA_START=112 /DNA_END=338 /DNA_ORIENTATION=-